MIEKTRYFWGNIGAYWIFVVIGLCILSLLVVQSVLPIEIAITVGIVIAVLIIMDAGRQFVIRQSIRRRQSAIYDLSQQMKLAFSPIESVARSANFMNVVGPGDPPRTLNIVGDNAGKIRYFDHQHDVLRSGRYGTYRVATVHYSFVMADLPRQLPTMLFDSPKAHDKQFKTHFDRRQAQSLEGDFDKYFTTYVPKFYHIDARAIITPEVMESMIGMSDYDIEITDDKLYVSGPLVPVGDIPRMIDGTRAIREKLLNNILTYRDERLYAHAGRRGVSIFGATLRKNPWQGWVATLIGGVGVAYLIYASFAFESPYFLLSDIGIIAMAAFGGGLYQMFKTRRHNKKADQRYMQMSRTTNDHRRNWSSHVS